MLQEMDILVETLDSVKQSNSKYLIPWQCNYVHGYIGLHYIVTSAAMTASCSVHQSCSAGLWPEGGAQDQYAKPPSNSWCAGWYVKLVHQSPVTDSSVVFDLCTSASHVVYPQVPESRCRHCTWRWISAKPAPSDRGRCLNASSQ